MTYDQVDRIHHMRPVIGERVRHRVSGHEGTVFPPTRECRRDPDQPLVRVLFPHAKPKFRNASPYDLLYLSRTPGEQLPDIEEAVR